MAATIKITINSSETGGGIEKTTKDLRQMGESAEKSGGGFTVMKGLAVNALTAVAGAALQAAAGVGKFLADSVGAAADFESGMNTFASAAGNMGQAELTEFKDLFLTLGKELPVSTKEVQDAATAMVKGGIDPAVVAGGALKDTLLFAAAAGMELEKSADLTAKMLSTFVSMTATAAEKTAFMAQSQELLVKAANASTLNVEALGDAMLMAGGAAKASGVSYDELVTTMGLISGAFPSAAEAGTSFKNMITRLIPTTNAAKEAMGELGLYTEETGSLFYDAQGNFIGMQETANLLQNAFAGLSDAQRAEAMATIFGNDAKGAAIALMDAGASGYDAFAASMANANGIQATSTATQQGLNFAMENMKGSVEALQITIGTKLLPVLTPLIMQFTAVLNGAIGVAEAIFDAGAGSTEFYEALGPLNAALGLAPGTLGAVYNAGVQVAGMLQALGTQAIPIAQMAFQNISAFIATVMPAMLGLVTSALTTMTAFWQAHGATITTIAQSTWQAIVGVFQIAIGVIQGVFAIFAAALTGDYTTMGAQLTQANELIWTGIRAFLEGFLEGVLSIFGSSLSELIATWKYNLAMIPVVAKVAIDGAIAAFESALGLAPGIGKAIIDGIARGISEGAGQLANAARQAAESALKAAKSALGIKSPSDVFNKQVGQPISEGIAQGIMAAGGSIQQALNGVLGDAMGGAKASVGISANPVRGGSSDRLSESIAGLVAKVGSGSTNNNFNYSPTYSAVPNQPSRDFAAMRSLAGAGV